MVINGAVGQQAEARDQLESPESLPDPELGAVGRSVLERRYLQPTPDGPLETPRQRLWAVATPVAAGSAGQEGEEARARRRRDYYLAMARLEFLPASAALANAGRGEQRPFLGGYVLPIPDSPDGLLALGQRAARVRQ